MIDGVTDSTSLNPAYLSVGETLAGVAAIAIAVTIVMSILTKKNTYV